MNKRLWNYGQELERVDCGVDFGNMVGYFVRVSVERDDGGTEWISLKPDEADLLAEKLREAATITRTRQQGRPDPPARP